LRIFHQTKIKIKIRRKKIMFAEIKSLGLFGLNAFEVDVEADISKGMPVFNIVGLPDTAVRESRERIRAALRTCSIQLPSMSIMVNLAPAGTKKSGSLYDMAILTAIIKAMGILNGDYSDCAFIGEVSLSGAIRPVDGVLPMVLEARRLGIRKIFVSEQNAYEASVAKDVEIYGVKDASQLIDHLCGTKIIEPQKPYSPSQEECSENIFDFCDVKGQQSAKKALEIAAAGGHSAFMIGPPGSGKSMLAKRLPSILPPLTFEEALETTNIYSIAGNLDRSHPLITERPFRTPHHTVSTPGLIGGGSIPHPGEISLAHNGVLFLDELAEFKRDPIEAMRQPMEDGKVSIVRTAATLVYPASVMVIAAMNPCPCGYYGHPKRKCTCTGKKISNYLSRISGPFRDRMDLHIDVAPVEFDDISSTKKEESSASIRKRVIAARNIQTERFKGTNIKCNAQMTDSVLHKYCAVSDKVNAEYKLMYEKLNLTGRAYTRVLKVARTIADLEECEEISERHILQAVQYRTLDRKYWYK